MYKYIYIYQGRGGGGARSVFPSLSRQPSGIKFYLHPQTLPPHPRPKQRGSPRSPVPAGNIVIPNLNVFDMHIF